MVCADDQVPVPYRTLSARAWSMDPTMPGGLSTGTFQNDIVVKNFSAS